MAQAVTSHLCTPPVPLLHTCVPIVPWIPLEVTEVLGPLQVADSMALPAVLGLDRCVSGSPALVTTSGGVISFIIGVSFKFKDHRKIPCGGSLLLDLSFVVG